VRRLWRYNRWYFAMIVASSFVAASLLVRGHYWAAASPAAMGMLWWLFLDADERRARAVGRLDGEIARGDFWRDQAARACELGRSLVDALDREKALRARRRVR
jgi:hypothetical protein